MISAELSFRVPASLQHPSTGRYRLCYVGVPLPPTYQDRFIELTEFVHARVPNAETWYPSNSGHISLLYNADLSEEKLDAVEKVVSDHVGVLRDVSLHIGGFLHFPPPNLRYIGMDVTRVPPLTTFSRAVNSGLLAQGERSKVAGEMYHVTLAKIAGLQASMQMLANQRMIATRLNGEIWEFPIEWIAIFGRDTEGDIRKSTPLRRIPVRP